VIKSIFFTLQNGGNPNVMKNFHVLVRMDVMNMSRQVLTWCQTQNERIMFVLTTLVQDKNVVNLLLFSIGAYMIWCCWSSKDQSLTHHMFVTSWTRMIISTISLAWMFKAQLISMIWGMKTIYMRMTPLANMHFIKQKSVRRILTRCLWNFFSTWTITNDFTSSSDIYPQHGRQMLVTFLTRLKFDIATGFLSTKLHAVPCIQVVKIYYKTTIHY
jgi:hypothetical protein